VTAGQKIAHAMGLSHKERELIGIACAFHDVVQFWDEDCREDGSTVRKRLVGGNEEASRRRACEWMMISGRKYSLEEISLVGLAIIATTPFWDNALGTVVQKINPDTHPVVRTVAMADLATVGIDPREFDSEADALFIEDNLDITRAIDSGQQISNESQDWYLSRYRAWRKLQIDFAKGRKIQFEKDIEGLGLEAKVNLRKLFSRFDESIEQAQASYDHACGILFGSFSLFVYAK
jgi:hypothetical protein